jgi:hypothetical protein
VSDSKPEPLRFHAIDGMTVRGDFEGGALSSDFGTILLRETEHQIGLIDRLTDAIHDRRHPSYIEHSMNDLLTQRIFQVACGYEDANDSNTLRHDPMFKLGAGHRPLDAEQDLAHASTFTRLGQSLSRTDIYRIAQAFLEHFVSSYATPPEIIVLDLDHTDHLVYGQQELALFNAHYGDDCYLPLWIFEGLSGRLISAVLRAGKSPDGHENTAILKRVLAGLRRHWPETHMIVRGDMGFAQPQLMREVQADAQADFIFGLGAGHPKTLRPKAGPWLAEARQALAKGIALAKAHNRIGPERVRLYGEVDYRAGTWEGIKCRVCCKAEVNRLGDNPRFVVTSLTNADPETVYRNLYCARGQDENYIKQLKNDLVGDRMSEQGFVANHLRLFYACAAYELMHALRRNTLKGTGLERAQPATLRHKLFKLAVRVVQYADRIKLHLPTACPVAGVLQHVTEIFYRTPRLKPG